MLKRVAIYGYGLAELKLAQILAHDRRFEVTLVTDRDSYLLRPSLLQDQLYDIDINKFLKTSAINVSANAPTDPDIEIRTKQNRVPKGCYSLSDPRSIADLKRLVQENISPTSELKFVVVGGGEVGVEKAAELAVFLNAQAKKGVARPGFHIDLIEAAPRLLPKLPERVATIAEKRLKKLGIRIYKSTTVSPDDLKLPEGDSDSHQIIWTPGSAAVSQSMAQTELNQGCQKAATIKMQLFGSKANTLPMLLPISVMRMGKYWTLVNMKGITLYGPAGWAIGRWNLLLLLAQLMPKRRALWLWLH